MRLYRTSVKEDLNVSGVFQHLAENYVNKVKSFTENNGLGAGHGGGGLHGGGYIVSESIVNYLLLTE